MSNSKSSVVIIGGGIMGGDIAIIFAAGGWDAHVMSPSQKTRDALPARIAAGMKQMGVSAAQAGKVCTYPKLDDIDWKHIDLVIEAATEDLALKQKLFLQVEALARPDIPLTSNTSNFPISEIGKALKTRNRIAGTHFFMPAHLVPLVEVVSGTATDPKVAEGLCTLMKDLGKAPIWVKKDVPGFVGNRIQHAMMREALYLIDEGVVSPEGVDIAVRFGFGFRFIACGPIMQKEMSGWDTNYLVGSALYPHLHNETTYPAVIKNMVDKGHIGMKTKRGFWEWTDDSAAREKARIEKALQAGFEIIRNDLENQA